MPTFTLRIEFDSEDEMTRYLLRDKAGKDYASPLPEHYLRPVGREPIPDLPEPKLLVLPPKVSLDTNEKSSVNHRSYSDTEMEYIREFHKTQTAKQIAKHLSRSPTAVSQLLSTMRRSGELPSKFDKK